MNKLTKKQEKWELMSKGGLNKDAVGLYGEWYLEDILSEKAEELSKEYSRGFSHAYSNLKNTGVLPKALALQRKELIEEIEKVLEKGHGGGNWRRLIILVLSRLKNNKAK